MSDILVIGSAGFIGSNVTNYLIQHCPKLSISSIDCLDGTSDIAPLDKLSPSINARNRHTFYLNNIDDQDLTAKIFMIEKPKVVLYAAVDTSETILTNLSRLQFVHGKQIEKLIVLGNIRNKQRYWHELSRAFRSSLSSSVLVHFMPGCNVFGPRQTSLDASSASSIWKSLQDGIDRPLNDFRFDFMYIKDYFDAIFRAISNERAESTWLPVRSLFTTTLPQIKQFTLGLMSGHRGYLENHGSVDRDIGAFSGNIKHSIEEAIEHTAAWYSANKWIWLEKSP